MQPKTFVLLLLLFPSMVFAQAFTYNSGKSISANYYAEIPYTIIKGKIFIDAEINGSVVKCLFDTGAPLQIGPSLASEIKEDKRSRAEITDAYGHKDSVNTIIVDQVKLGSATFGKVTGLDFFPDLYKCWNIDAVIGSNIFYQSIVHIDPVKHLIIVTNDLTKLGLQNTQGIDLNTNNVQSYPFIKIMMGKVAFDFGFDSGDEGFLAIPEMYMDFGKKYKTFKKLSTGYGANEIGVGGYQKQAVKYRLQASTVAIGDARFTNVITDTQQGSGPRIGTKLLDYGSVTFDFIHHKFYFTENEPVINADESQWPMQPTIRGDKLYVGVVWDEVKDKFKVGEQIVAIDGVNLTTVDLCEWVKNNSILFGKEKATVTVKDEDGGLHAVEMTKISYTK